MLCFSPFLSVSVGLCQSLLVSVGLCLVDLSSVSQIERQSKRESLAPISFLPPKYFLHLNNICRQLIFSTN